MDIAVGVAVVAGIAALAAVILAWAAETRRKIFIAAAIVFVVASAGAGFLSVGDSDDDSEVLDAIEAKAALDHIYDTPIEFLIITARFSTLEPDELALVVLGQDIAPIRFDFAGDGVALAVEQQYAFNNPLTPLSRDISAEDGLYLYSVDFNFLRQVAPENPLSSLTLRNLDNAAVQLLLDDMALERISDDTNDGPDFSVNATAEVGGYGVNVFAFSLETGEQDLRRLRMPRTVPEKPGFAMLVLPKWRTMLEVVGEISLSDIPKAVDYLERESHLESWRGLWPDNYTLMFFNSVHKIPMAEQEIVFHPWNQRFVRLREEFGKSGGTSVPGISAFYIPAANFFYLFATVDYESNDAAVVEHSVGDNTIQLSRNEVATIHNIILELSILNNTWVELEGNYIQGLAVLLPKREKYMFLSSARYYEFTLRHQDASSSGQEQLATEAVLSSITLILDLGP